MAEHLKLETFIPFVISAAKVVFILFGAWVTAWVVRRLVARINRYAIEAMERNHGTSRIEMEKRARTISRVVGRALMAAIWFSAVIMALKAGFEIDATPLLAGAGVVGIAIGFGAQSLVKDVITGLFMLMENQIRINDVVTINGVSGLVEEINLRTTVIRSVDGTVHIFPNGSIGYVSNQTFQFSYYVFDIGVSYKEDTDRVVVVLRQVAEELRAVEPFSGYILDPLDVLGVDKFADSSVIIKARIRTVPLQQWAVGREMNRRIKQRFDAEGIEMPIPQRALHWVGGGGQEREDRRQETGDRRQATGDRG